MTVKREPLYQVWATETKTGNLVPMPFFPRIEKGQAEVWAQLARDKIREGKLKEYSDPHIALHLS